MSFIKNYKGHKRTLIVKDIMDTIKDIIKKEDIYYSDNTPVLFIYERLEKIIMAVYMVTSFLSDEEPLKFNLRNKNIKLMSFTSSLKDKKESSKDELFLKISSLISEINSFLKIAYSVKLISEMNYSILNEEYKKFLNLIIENKKEEKVISFPSDFFNNKRDIKDIYIGQKTKGHTFDKGHSESIKDIVIKKQRVSKVIKKSKNNQERNERRDLIIKIIKDRKDIPDGQSGVSIKDISDKIKNCSGKTIQRELNALLKENLIKKEGERRWSRYLLK